MAKHPLHSAENLLQLAQRRHAASEALNERLKRLLEQHGERRRKWLENQAKQDQSVDRPERRSQGFTLIELLVVIAVIAALASLTYIGIFRLFAKQQDDATYALVTTVAGVIASESSVAITIPDDDADPDNDPTRRLFDFNNDEILDGDPRLAFDTADADLADSVNYRGFIKYTEWTQTHQIDDKGRILDTWRRPLRIRFHPSDYGSAGVGIWSYGRDGKDGTEDDICSWKVEP